MSGFEFINSLFLNTKSLQATVDHAPPDRYTNRVWVACTCKTINNRRWVGITSRDGWPNKSATSINDTYYRTIRLSMSGFIIEKVSFIEYWLNKKVITDCKKSQT
jgi:hypothetical protein